MRPRLEVDLYVIFMTGRKLFLKTGQGGEREVIDSLRDAVFQAM